MSRFAALDLSSDEESSGEDFQANSEPVAYAMKEINWKITEAIYNLREFRVQNIYRNTNGLTLRFINEHEAQKAFRHLRQALKLKFSPLKVPLLLRGQLCFHCGKEGHWGNDCIEGPFWTLPLELYSHIAKFIQWPDTFSFLYTSKRFFKVLAPKITELYIARPGGRFLAQMTFKLGILHYLKNLNKLTIKSITSKSVITPQMLMSLPNLSSLSIVNCRQIPGTNFILSQQLMECIGGMTKLTKLDLDKQWSAKSASHLSLLHCLTNLTQLRLHLDARVLNNGQLNELTVLGNLKKLGVTFGGCNFSLTDELLTNLTSLIITSHCGNSVTLPKSLPALKQLKVCANVIGLESAPNLTKLEWLSAAPITIKDCFSSLVSLTKQFDKQQKDPVLIQMPQLKKLVVRGLVKHLTLDLAGAISLKKLGLRDTAETTIKNAPASLQEIIVVPPWHRHAIQ
jgi:hypothetical protein